MAVLTVRTVPDPVLRRKGTRITKIDTKINKLIDDMLETLPAVHGVGLAAPQVGVPLQLAVIQVDEEDEPVILVNPEIVKRSGLRLVSEACLSIPGYKADIKRSDSVLIKARNRNGKEFRLKASGLLGQALEHEIDHLNGVLYIDHLESPDYLQRVEADEEEQDL